MSSDDESCFFQSKTLYRVIPMTEKAVQLKLSGKRHNQKHSKKNLAPNPQVGFCDLLTPGSMFLKRKDYASITSEPVKLDFAVQNNEIVKYGTW